MTLKIEGGLPVARPPGATSSSAVTRAGSERNQPVAAAASDSIRLTGEAEGLNALGRQLGAAPAGIDFVKVDAMRAAIADGSYRVDEQQIAVRMLDLERELGKV